MTLRLPYVSYKEIKKYSTNDYEIEVPNINLNISRNRKTKHKEIFNEIITQDTSGNTFYINTKSGNKIVISSMGSYVLDGTKKVKCWWCSKKYNRDNVGIPIDIIKKKGSVQVFTYGYTCCKECSYAFIVEEKKKGVNCSTIYKNADTHLKLLHSLMHSDEDPLVAAKDFKLLREFGGSLTREQWEDKNTKFTGGDFVIVPIRQNLVEMKFKNTNY